MEIKDIEQIVGQEYKIDNIFHKSRERIFVEPRAIFFWILRTKLHVSYPKMAKISGYNHATIINHIRRVEGQMEYDKVLKNRITSILSRIYFDD